jgi:phage terminase large subunit GpA-like protein
MPARRSTNIVGYTGADMAAVLAGALRPRQPLMVSEWAAAHRQLTGSGSAEPGPWRNARTPYLVEPMDALSAHSPVERVVLRFAAQMGKTEVGLNWLGYLIHHCPAPVLVVVPTLEVRARWVRQRLLPMLSQTPALSAIFDAKSQRDGGNSAEIKEFPGGMLVLGGANSPASLASMPIQYVIADEVDRFPWEAGAEGDPLGLVEERQNTFVRRKLLMLSTPTVADLSRIDDAWQASDQRSYHVPCPYCGTRQILTWQRADGSLSLHRHGATGEVGYRCVACDGIIREEHKPAMLAAGRWIAAAPGRPARGYSLSQLYAPVGLGRTWAELLANWEDARHDSAKLKRFTNTSLGLPWTEAGDSLDPLRLQTRLEDYPERIPGAVRTVGADVQKDRIEATVADWGPGEECWVQDHMIIPGDTADGAVWDEFRLLLEDLAPDACCVDSGYRPDEVYRFQQSARWVFATKGMAGAHRPITEDEQRRRQRMRQRGKRGAPIYLIGTDPAKGLLYARAKLAEPGPGYLHFRNQPAFDAEYFAQLAAEKLVTKFRGRRPYTEWVATRPRNEALDCWILALAALRLSGRSSAAAVVLHRRPTGQPTAPASPTPAAAPAPPASPAPGANQPPPTGRARQARGGWARGWR